MSNKNFNSNRLFAGFTAAILLVLLVGGLSYYTLNRQAEERDWTRHTYTVLQKVDDVERLIINMETGRRGYRCTGDRVFLQPYYESQPKMVPVMAELQHTVADNSEQLENVQTLAADVAAVDSLWKSININTIYRSDSEKRVVTLAEKYLMDRVRADIDKVNAVEVKLLNIRENSETDSISQTMLVLVCGILLILLVVGALIRSILKEFKTRVKAERSLLEKFAELETVNAATQRSNWLLSGIREINDSLVGHDTVSGLLQASLNRIADYMELPAGAFYFYDPSDKKLHLKGRVSLPAGSYSPVDPGVGIVGQVAEQKEIKVISNIPADYWTISSALGAQLPDTLICVPVWLNNELKGVLELACQHAQKEDFIGLLEAVTNNISIAINGAYAAEFTSRLLQQVQEQKEELESQQEELRQTNEELTHQADVLRASEEELKLQEEELRQINVELEEKTEAVESARNALAQKASELEQSNRYKSEFLANMSHELRTPLNSVLILANLLRENKFGNLNEKQTDYARIIHKSGSDLLDLINDILDLSKIEAGKLDIIFEEVVVAEVARDIDQLFYEQAIDKKIVFTSSIDASAPLKIVTDKQRLEQVLKNLLSNAIKFTPENGQVSLNFKSDDAGLSITVSDTGIGIPADKQQLIFEAFRQADGATNRKFGGTGLGLSISRELVRKLNGTIQVTSQAGQGSIFTITLPVVLAEAATITHGTEATNDIPVFDEEKVKEQSVIEDDRATLQPGDQTILIIEDDLQFARIVVEFAKAHNYKVVVAVSGDEGIFYAHKYKPVAIILDLGLPVIDGRNVLKILKATDGVKNIPVHVISAEDRWGLQGIENYFRKPLSSADLDRAFAGIDAYVSVKYKSVLVVAAEANSEQLYTPLAAGADDTVKYQLATSAHQATLMIADRRFDCIIMDIGRDIATGIGTLKQVRQRAPDAYIITCVDADLNNADEIQMTRLVDRIVRRAGKTAGRLLDEVDLFLHKIKSPSLLAMPQGIQHEADKNLKGKRVLLADDDMRNVFALTSVLEENGLEVFAAANGKEAVALLKSTRKIDIVLMDIMMPEMDGYDAMRAIRALPQFSTLPIIALTAKAMTEDREKCLQAGASDYIAKPIENSKLLSLMRVWISG